MFGCCTRTNAECGKRANKDRRTTAHGGRAAATRNKTLVLTSSIEWPHTNGYFNFIRCHVARIAPWYLFASQFSFRNQKICANVRFVFACVGFRGRDFGLNLCFEFVLLLFVAMDGLSAASIHWMELCYALELWVVCVCVTMVVRMVVSILTSLDYFVRPLHTKAFACVCITSQLFLTLINSNI